MSIQSLIQGSFRCVNVAINEKIQLFIQLTKQN